MKNVILLSDLHMNQKLETRARELVAGKDFKLAYIPSMSDIDRRYFHPAKEYFTTLGVKEILYFDVDEEYHESLVEELLECDGIYLSGGNTFYFLKKLQERNLLGILRGMVEKGKLLIGVSAGSIMMSDTIEIAEHIDENFVQLKDFDSLGLVDFQFMPHWNSLQQKLEDLLIYTFDKNKTIFTCNDGDGIIVQGEDVEFYGIFFKIENGKINEVRS